MVSGGVTTDIRREDGLVDCENSRILHLVNLLIVMFVLEKICAELDCDVGDIVDFMDLQEVKKKIHEN